MTETEIEQIEAQYPPVDEKLIVNGRYRIVGTNGKPLLHTRVTNFAKELDSTYNLDKWKLRTVLLGAAQRTDIIAAVLANSDDKRKLDQLASDAQDAAKANVKREIGSALHRMCERVDEGETLKRVPPWDADVAAYQKAVADAGLTVVMSERVCVLPDLNLAGRFDRIVANEAGDLFILDLKTSQTLDWSWGAIGIQLALYTIADTIYDPETQEHIPMPDVSKETAYVAHLASGSGQCIVYAVDLALGLSGIETVKQLKEFRKQSKNQTFLKRIGDSGE